MNKNEGSGIFFRPVGHAENAPDIQTKFFQPRLQINNALPNNLIQRAASPPSETSDEVYEAGASDEAAA